MPDTVPEPRDVMIRRLAMRAMRRGIKEMDLILPPFAHAALPGMSDAEMGVFDRLLSENDHDLYAWVTGQIAPPADYAPLVARIADGAVGVVRPE